LFVSADGFVRRCRRGPLIGTRIGIHRTEAWQL
jgi:hypothetical protein